MFNQFWKVKYLILSLLLVISVILTGCGESNSGKSNPPSNFKPYVVVSFPDVWITGPLDLYVLVMDPSYNNDPMISVNNVKLYVDGNLLAADTKPETTTSIQFFFPKHTWDSRNYNSGIHTVSATASTSIGDLQFEGKLNIRHYMPEFIVQGPNSNSYATAKLKRYDTDKLISDALVNINGEALPWNGSEYTKTGLSTSVNPGDVVSFSMKQKDMEDVTKSIHMPYPVVFNPVSHTTLMNWLNGTITDLNISWQFPSIVPSIPIHSQYFLVVETYDSSNKLLTKPTMDTDSFQHNYNNTLSRNTFLPSNAAHVKIYMLSCSLEYMGCWGNNRQDFAITAYTKSQEITDN